MYKYIPIKMQIYWKLKELKVELKAKSFTDVILFLMTFYRRMKKLMGMAEQVVLSKDYKYPIPRTEVLDIDEIYRTLYENIVEISGLGNEVITEDLWMTLQIILDTDNDREIKKVIKKLADAGYIEPLTAVDLKSLNKTSMVVWRLKEKRK